MVDDFLSGDTWEDTFPHEVFVKSVVLRELRMKGGEQMAALPQRNNCPGVPGVCVILVFRDERLRAWE